MSTELAIGPHRFRYQDALVFLEFTDTIEEAHAAGVIDQCGATTRKQPFAIVCETPGMKNVTPKARKVFADGFKGMPVAAAAFVGASIRTRAIVTFVVTAINVFRDRKMAFSFFDGQDEAREWSHAQLRAWKE